MTTQTKTNRSRGRALALGSALLLGALSLVGCSSAAEHYQWSPPLGMPKETIVHMTKDVLKEKKLVQENVEEGTLEYDWEEILLPFSFEGRRKKTFIKVENKAKGKPVFSLGVLVKQEVCEDVVEDEKGEDVFKWKDGGYADGDASLLLFRIVRKVGPPEESASSEWLRRQQEREELLRQVDRYTDEHPIERRKQ